MSEANMSSQRLELQQTLLASKKNVVVVNVADNCNPLLTQLLQLAQEIQHEDVLSMKMCSQGGYINTPKSGALVSSTSVPALMSLSNDKLFQTSRCDGNDMR
ncbi:hypothetical protein DPMN_087560 [Dreissena polymorpha]|uniref:Uncharacterized protein n=1 Tax=Dreissena polymorpha TaxID=45954 RepID=A0A9D4KTE0_DREPO|nr:hypothetical protein DPMN_087560 [Dreissena polymorpha]